MRTAVAAAAVGAVVAVLFTEASADRVDRAYRVLAELLVTRPPPDADPPPRLRLVLDVRPSRGGD